MTMVARVARVFRTGVTFVDNEENELEFSLGLELFVALELVVATRATTTVVNEDAGAPTIYRFTVELPAARPETNASATTWTPAGLVWV